MNAPNLRATDDQHFDADVASSPLVLVKFTGTWCPPCRALQPTLEKLAAERADVLVLTVDVDEEQQVAQRYGVRGVPTLLAFRDGKPVGQLIGAHPRANIEKLLGAAPRQAPATAW